MPYPCLPRRIVSLQPSATVTLSALGKLDSLVACTKYCAKVVPEILTLKTIIVADSWSAQSAQIMAARPDLVIASVPYQEDAVCEILKAGARFLGLAPKCMADIHQDIAVIAALTGVPEKGSIIMDEMHSELDSVRRESRTLSRPRVYCEEWGKPLIISQRWVAELVEAAGGNFCGFPGSKTTAEAVSNDDPEVLIFAWCGAGDRVPLEKVVAQRQWQHMTAVKHGHVYCIRDEFLNTPAPTLISGLHALASGLHPEVFPQVEGIRAIGSEAVMG